MLLGRGRQGMLRIADIGRFAIGTADRSWTLCGQGRGGNSGHELYVRRPLTSGQRHEGTGPPRQKNETTLPTGVVQGSRARSGGLPVEEVTPRSNRADFAFRASRLADDSPVMDEVHVGFVYLIAIEQAEKDLVGLVRGRLRR